MKIYIDTLGCPKNFNDSEMAAGLLEHSGHEIVKFPEDADFIMVNTCGFINDAKTESIERIFELAEYKENGAVLAVSGCLSQRYADELFEEMPEVDIFLGVNDYNKLPEILDGFEAGKREKHRGDYCVEFEESMLRKLEDNPYTATLRISEGCNNLCAYCVIPHIRGKFRSRKQEVIVREAEWLVQQGTKEIILIAQDVTSYGIDLYGDYVLPQLLKKLCRIDGLKWLRLMYCYEDRITDELIQVMAEEEKICNYIDIPLQHCSDAVLKAMNRRSTNSSIRETIGKLRTAMPDINIRTTFIVGFPGETEDDFEELMDFTEEMCFERLGVFTYSMEEGTPAAEMENQIDEEVKAERQDAVMRMQVEISLEHNQTMVGKTLDVLVEEIDPEGAYIGRTQYDAPEIDNSVIFTSDRELVPGDFVKVQINDAFDYDLTGKEVY
ncbi:MAG: 30S ribosomal protein S12 methylthiotransferase RimO [Firmicutes bacterium]|nr:30S ribosomal protein S12 methylthiotransferase RimO [Bacillota bacterium]